MTERIYKKPWPGLVALIMAFLAQWLGHSAYRFIEGVFGAWHYWAAFAIGAAGCWVVWRGLHKPEMPATWFGLLGGLLIWVGWFEFSFHYFAELYGVQGFEVDQFYTATPASGILQATMPVMFGLFFLYGFANSSTKCNFMRWFHRRLGISPGMPARQEQRNFARITALEMIFVIWFCYLFWLYAFYLGVDSPIVAGLYVGWSAWAAYLVWKLLQIPRVGHAIRYGIPTGAVAWGSFEMPSYFGAYPEIWLQPFTYPITSLSIVAIFGACFIYLARYERVGSSRRSASSG